MVVRIAHTVSCTPIGDEPFYGEFMTTIKCHYNIKMQDFRDRLQKVYPFLIIDEILDLDGEPVLMTEELRDVWKGYLSYEDGRKLPEEKENDGDENRPIPLPAEPISIRVRSHYSSRDPNDWLKFKKLIEENLFSKQLIRELRRYDAKDDKYSIKFPGGVKYKLNGHSYDSLEGTDTLVDQLLTSSEKYVVTDTETGEFVELSTQQCIIVDSFENGSPFKPYIMVNKSGLRQLEKLGPIDTLKIRFGHKETTETTETTAADTPTGSTIDNGPVRNSYQAVFSAYSELIGLFSEITNDESDMSEHDRRVLSIIEAELIPLLESISLSMGEPEENLRKWSFTGIAKGGLDLLGRFYNVWVSNGLILTIIGGLFQYAAKNALYIFILCRLHLNYNYLVGMVLFLGLLDERMLSMVEKISTEGGIGWAAKVHSLLKTCRSFLQFFMKILLIRIIELCLLNRPVCNRDNTIARSEVEAEILRLHQWNGLGRVVYPVLRFGQNIVLFAVALFPPGTTELEAALARRTHGR